MKVTLQPIPQEAPETLTVNPVEAGVFTVDIADQQITLALHWESAIGGWANVQETGEVMPFFLCTLADKIQLWVGGTLLEFQQTTTTAPRRAQAGGGQALASGEVKAPMPGTVLKILVAPGESVAANAPLLVMESMKMEMTLSAPAACTVKAIACQVGQLVEMNALLITLETGPDADNPA